MKGTLVKVSGRTVLLRTTDGVLGYALDSHCVVHLNDEVKQLEDLRPGDEVSVSGQPATEIFVSRVVGSEETVKHEVEAQERREQHKEDVKHQGEKEHPPKKGPPHPVRTVPATPTSAPHHAVKSVPHHEGQVPGQERTEPGKGRGIKL